MIHRVQFSRYDGELHPECHNKEYLEYSQIGNDIITYGYQDIDNSGSYKWVKLIDLKQ